MKSYEVSSVTIDQQTRCDSGILRHDYCFSLFFAEDSHEKNQALFSSKDKSKKLKCRLLQFLFVTLTVKYFFIIPHTSREIYLNIRFK